MVIFACILFVFASGFLFYSLFGYPLLLAVLARRRSKPVGKDGKIRTVSIIIPVVNGEQWIGPKLSSIAALDYPAQSLQVIVVSDGSTDRTESLAAEFPGVQVIRIPKSGKAAAVNAGMARATGEILFFNDVRQRLKADCLTRIVACFADPDVGGVCGELMIADGATQDELSVGLYWKIEKWIRGQLSSMGTLLVVTGCIYAVRRRRFCAKGVA
jgi:cellulose synthase/poly-beta-1,6-N-acetylglucosamine synthase-like glycosyltransferase